MSCVKSKSENPSIKKNGETKIPRTPKSTEHSISSSPAPTKKMRHSIKNFSRIRTLGTGTFGNVILMRTHAPLFLKGSNRAVIAMKVLNKNKVVHFKQEAHTLNEKQILATIDFIFTVHMYFSFKDNANLYMALEYVPGGELFSLLKKQNKLSEDHSRFYAVQVLLTFEYLHNQKIIYRDLKPENILLTIRGYIKITDFGFSKVVPFRTYTLCGTPEYLAPEILNHRGYDKSVDWWAFGVLIFEMVVGLPPFVHDNVMEVYSDIMESKYTIPDYFSEPLRDLIRSLVCKDISSRLGCLKESSEGVKAHAWFQETNWTMILEQKEEPPYVPKVSSESDTKNFDVYNETEIEESRVPLFSEEFANF